MPKGVEHFPAASTQRWSVSVFHSLMPKGVEHFLILLLGVVGGMLCFIR